MFTNIQKRFRSVLYIQSIDKEVHNPVFTIFGMDVVIIIKQTH